MCWIGQIYSAIAYYFPPITQNLLIFRVISLCSYSVSTNSTNEHQANPINGDNTQPNMNQYQKCVRLNERNSNCLLANQIYYIPFTLFSNCYRPNHPTKSVSLCLITIFSFWTAELRKFKWDFFRKNGNVWNWDNTQLSDEQNTQNINKTGKMKIARRLFNSSKTNQSTSPIAKQYLLDGGEKKNMSKKSECLNVQT